jgi:hypothetical protein
MLGHSRATSILADANPNKFKSLGKYTQFLEAKRQILRLADPELALHAHHHGVEVGFLEMNIKGKSEC